MSRRKFIQKDPPAKLPPLNYDGYPPERALKIIEQWNCIDNTHAKLHALLDYVESLWFYPDRFCWYKTTSTEEYADPKDWTKYKVRYRKLYISTGGWSGNESIIYALERNFMFWAMNWRRHDAGGHYWFRIPEIVKKTRSTNIVPKADDCAEQGENK